MSPIARNEGEFTHHMIGPEPWNYERKRTGQDRPPKIPTRNRFSHGQRINREISQAFDNITSKREIQGISPDRLFVLEFDSENKDLREVLSRFEIGIVDEYFEKTEERRKYKYIVQFPDIQTKDRFIEEIGLYQSGSNEIGALHPGMRRDFFNGFSEARQISPEERKGQRLNRIGIPDREEFYIDVQIWSMDNQESRNQALAAIRHLVSTKNGEYISCAYISNLIVVKVHANEDLYKALLECDLVAQVDLPPEPFEGFGAIFSDDTGTIEEVIPTDSDPIACIIDTGVVSGHPLLRGWIIEERDFDTGDDTATDMNGHGTSVAGIVVYGDVNQCLTSNSWIPKVAICSAKVLDKDARWPEKELREEKIEKAIRHFHRERKCRVFNLSIGDDKEVYQNGRQFPLAEKLDALARELDIVIVVSSGNRKDIPIPTGFNNQQEFHKEVLNQIILNEEQRLCNPATSSLSISVGSIARSDALMAMDGGAPIRDSLIGSPKNCVSPFSRCGPGYSMGTNCQIKPECVHYGGNLAITGQTHQARWTDGEIAGEPTIRMERDGRYIETRTGTSFACPHVTHGAAIVQKCLEESMGERTIC